MSKSSIKITGFDKLSKQLQNMQNNISNFEGDLSIEKDNILNNIDNFNQTFHTTFNNSTTDDEFINYFNEQYTALVQKYIVSKVNCKNKFNSKFNGYAYIK